jgi:hypothetical protein
MSELELWPGTSGSARLERGYRRVLACYPRAYRRENEEEILAVLLACAGDGQQRPGLAESADLIKAGIRMRLRPAARPPRTVRAAVRLVCACAAAELAVLVTEVVTAGSVRSAYARKYPPTATQAVYHAVNVHLAADHVKAAIAVGVLLLLAWALIRGRNLARFAFAAFFGLDWLSLFQASHQSAMANAPSDMAVGIAIWVLALAAGVLLFTGPSNRYYRSKSLPATLWHRTFGTS